MNKFKIAILFLSLGTMLLSSCKRDLGESNVLSGEEREIEMKFYSPATYAAGDETTQEKELKNIMLLVFDGDGDNAKFLYSRTAWKTNTTTTSYRSTLIIGSGLTIYFVANGKSFLESLPSTVLVPNETWSDIRSKLVMSYPYGLTVADGLPMWGRLTNKSIEDKPLNNLGTVKLLRSVASVDVDVRLTTPTEFTLHKGHLVFSADRGYLPYDPSKITTSGSLIQANAPYAPSNMVANKTTVHAVAAGEHEISNVFYMYDNTASLTPAAGDNRQTKVILEGVWNNPSGIGQPTFYPLAFRNKTSNEKIQVMRNTKYLIVVTKVNGDGYGNIDDAKNAEDVNMDYDVIPWNDNVDGDIYIDGPKYFSIPTKTATLFREKDSTFEIPFKTNYALTDILMKFNEADAGVTGTLDTHHQFKIEVLSKTENGQTVTYFKFTANEAYDPTYKSQTMIVSVGRIKFNIFIRQLSGNPDDWNDGGDEIIDI